MSTPEPLMELLREELTPVPHPDFAAAMDEWAAAGFPRRDAGTQRRRPRAVAWLHRAARAVRSPLGIAATATAVAAVATAVVLLSDSTTHQTTPDGGGPMVLQSGPKEGAANSAAGQAAPAGPQVALPPTGGGSIAPGQRDRKLERSAQLTLGAPADDLQSVADRIVEVTDRHRGFVLLSQVSTGDHPSGDFQLRLPGAELQATLRDLSALGDVRARSDSGQDITQEFVSVTDSLQAAGAERRGLLRRLATATGDARIQHLRDRLDRNARERSGLRAQLRDLRERTSYAAVSVSLVEGKGHSGGAGGGGSTSAALKDSLRLLVGSFNWLLRALGVLIPVALVGGVAWWSARAIRRRRREAVLF